VSEEVNRCLVSAESWDAEFYGERLAASRIEICEMCRRLYPLLWLIKDEFDLW
jgi:hypothetical protein